MNSLLLLVCIFLVVPHSIATHHGKVNCDPDNRPEVCPSLSDPVCGWCPHVTKDFSNGCEACRDSLVQYYVSGECLVNGLTSEEENVLEEWSEEESILTVNILIVATDEEDETDEPHLKCNTSSWTGASCPLEYEPVCGFPIGITAPNACTACSEGAEYYTKGAC